MKSSQVLLQYNAKNKGFIQDKEKKEVVAIDNICMEDMLSSELRRPRH